MNYRVPDGAICPKCKGANTDPDWNADTNKWTCEACDSTGIPPMTWEDLHGTPVSIAKRWKNRFSEHYLMWRNAPFYSTD
ncbi:MAG: hypothetical protein MN733_22820 [Nitrososphaera sp.]|nr:hypothetical protein [Nitrososphaera sp.]